MSVLLLKAAVVAVVRVKVEEANRLGQFLRLWSQPATRNFGTTSTLSGSNAFSKWWDSVFGALTKPEGRLVGTDDLGNRYFEADPNKDSVIPHRANKSMRYFLMPGQRSVEDPWMRLNSDLPSLPNEWDSWLRHSRPDPPTPEEITGNRLAAASRIHKAQGIERKRLEKLQQSYATSGGNDETFSKKEDPKRPNDSRPFPRHQGLEVNAGDSQSRSA